MRFSLRLLPVFFGLLVLASGCTEEIAAPPELRAYYTLWGAFDPTADMQAVRVIPISDTISVGSADPLPVTVTSVDIASGEEKTWRDSVVTFSNGAVGHVYVSDFRPAYGSEHVFRVRGEDGTETSALVAVPELIEPIRQTPDIVGGVTYPHLWIDAPRLNRVRAEYEVETQSCSADFIEVGLRSGSARPVEFGWQTRLQLRQEAAEVIGRYARLNEYEDPLALRKVTLIVEVASEDWRPPGGVFDPELLVEPGTLSNVTNGFGFIGSAYEVRVTWTPTFDEIARTPFRFPGFGDCGGV